LTLEKSDHGLGSGKSLCHMRGSLLCGLEIAILYHICAVFERLASKRLEASQKTDL